MTTRDPVATIEQAVATYTDAKAAVLRAEHNIGLVVAQVVDEDDPDLVRAICHALYWGSDLTATHIWEMVQPPVKRQRLFDYVGDGPVMRECTQCGGDIRPKSRTAMTDIGERCTRCQTELDEAHQRDRDHQRDLDAARRRRELDDENARLAQLAALDPDAAAATSDWGAEVSTWWWDLHNVERPSGRRRLIAVSPGCGACGAGEPIRLLLPFEVHPFDDGALDRARASCEDHAVVEVNTSLWWDATPPHVPSPDVPVVKHGTYVHVDPEYGMSKHLTWSPPGAARYAHW